MINEAKLKELLEFMNLQNRELIKRVERLETALQETSRTLKTAISYMNELVSLVNQKFDEVDEDIDVLQETVEHILIREALDVIESSEPAVLDLLIVNL